MVVTAPGATCQGGSMARYIGGEPLRQMKHAMVVVMTAPSRLHPGVQDNFFRGIVSLHCSLLVARVNMTELPLVALTVGAVSTDVARHMTTLPGLILLNSPSLLQWRTLHCVGVRFDAVPGWDASAIGADSTPPPIEAASHVRASAFEKLLAWSLHPWIERALVVDVDVIMAPTGWPAVRQHIVGNAASGGIADFLTWHGVEFAAGPSWPFNSGVMLIRPTNRTMRDLATLVAGGGYNYHLPGKTGGDQDLLQAYFGPGFKKAPLAAGGSALAAPRGVAITLPHSFNVRTLHARARPSPMHILHYMGFPKPWSVIDVPGMVNDTGELVRPTLAHYHRLLGNRSRLVDPRALSQWALDLFHQVNSQCKALLNTKTAAQLRDGATAVPPLRYLSPPPRSPPLSPTPPAAPASSPPPGGKQSDACPAAASTEHYLSQTFDAHESAELDALINLMPSGQQTFADRRLVMNALAARGRNARLLVFGCGRDSKFWAHVMNRYGTTVFLEDMKGWADPGKSLTVHIVSYGTAPSAQWLSRLVQPANLGGATKLTQRDERDLMISGLPTGLLEQWWDVVLIDAPAGFNGRMPGRMSPIFQTSRILARQRATRPCVPVDVFVHDFNRPIEREWALMHLTPHARMLNYASLATTGHARTTQFPNATFLGWFHMP